jgi:hypothetical protein
VKLAQILQRNYRCLFEWRPNISIGLILCISGQFEFDHAMAATVDHTFMLAIAVNQIVLERQKDEFSCMEIADLCHTSCATSYI